MNAPPDIPTELAGLLPLFTPSRVTELAAAVARLAGLSRDTADLASISLDDTLTEISLNVVAARLSAATRRLDQLTDRELAAILGRVSPVAASVAALVVTAAAELIDRADLRAAYAAGGKPL